MYFSNMNKLFPLLIVLSTIFSCTDPKVHSSESTSPPTKNQKVVIAYVAGWNEIQAENIAAEKLTHINYAFCNVYDGLAQEGKNDSTRYEYSKRDSINYLELHKLKSRNKDLKIIGSIGGWTWSGGFHDAVLTPESRKRFTKSVVDYMLKYNLDGVDFDWEYPSLEGNHNAFGPEDKPNFVAMLKGVREALDSIESQTNIHYITSIASGGFDEYVDANDMGKAAKYLDYVNIMTYDFHGGWDSTTAHHTNLFDSDSSGRSADKAIRKHVEAGIPINKLVMGIAFYGRNWKGVTNENHGLYQQASGGGKGHSFKSLDTLIGKHGYNRYWDSTAQAPYLWNADSSIFVSYEDEQSIKAKCDYVNKNEMLGVMFWEYSEDVNGKLLDAIGESL